MVTFLTAAFLGGLFLLIAALLIWGMKAVSRRAHRRVAATPTTPLGSWQPGTRRAAAQGVIGHSQYGPVTGPVSGEECAWWQVQVDRHPSRDSDDRTGWDDLGVFAATGLPSLADSTGYVLVDPRVPVKVVTESHTLATVSHVRMTSTVPSYVPPRTVGKMRAYEELRLTEMRLPAGREVFVVGSVRRDREHGGAMLADGGGGTVFTVDRRDQVLHDLAENARSAQLVARVFGLAGLVITAVSLGLLYVQGS